MKIKTDNYEIYKGDCLEVMDKLIEQGVKVDTIITDPPYGTTACKWDDVIPFDEMWVRLNKLIKHNGAIVLFGCEPFSSKLRCSNLKNYKYDWKWDKVVGSNFVNAKRMPLKIYEDVCVFYSNQPTYNPQMTIRPKENERISGKSKLKESRINGMQQIVIIITIPYILVIGQIMQNAQSGHKSTKSFHSIRLTIITTFGMIEA